MNEGVNGRMLKLSPESEEDEAAGGRIFEPVKKEKARIDCRFCWRDHSKRGFAKGKRTQQRCAMSRVANLPSARYAEKRNGGKKMGDEFEGREREREGQSEEKKESGQLKEAK